MQSVTDKTLEAAISFFGKTTGEGVSSPCSNLKSGPSPGPFILINTANLDGLAALPIYKTPKVCDLKYIVLGCSCDRHIVPNVCMSVNCPNCKKYVSRRRSGSLFRRLLQNHAEHKNQYKRFKRQTVIYTIFTVPIMERYKYIDRATWQKVRKKAWQVLKKYFGGKFGVEVTHPAGDKDASVFHPHLNFLWVQNSGKRPFIDVEKLRTEWAKILNVEVADVYSQYSRHVRQIKHWCNYVSRTFPGTHGWTGPVRWYGKYPVITDKIKVVCARCKDTFRIIGWLGKDAVDNYYEHGFMIGLDPPWMRDSQINKFH